MSRRDEWPPTARLVLATLAMGALLLRGAFAQSTGTITTVAGGGPGTLPGPEASLLGNVKVVADSVGNLYVSHGLGHRVYRLDAGTGTLSPLAGSGFRGYAGDGGPALQAQLDNPYGLALDERQNRLYIAEVNNNVIRAVDLTTGLISTVAGTGTCGYSGDDGPATSARLCNLLSDLALDANGILYFATDFGGWRIRTVEDGIIRTLAGNGVVRGAIDGQGGDPADDYRDRVAATSTSLGAVTALAVDPSGVSLYFFEQAVPGGARIRRVDLEIFVLTTYAGNGLVYGQIDGPGGDPSDDVVEGAQHFSPRSGIRRPWPSCRARKIWTRSSIPWDSCAAWRRTAPGASRRSWAEARARRSAFHRSARV
jgi:DNA-binding beta-propeller fold protein YncE